MLQVLCNTAMLPRCRLLAVEDFLPWDFQWPGIASLQMHAGLKVLHWRFQQLIPMCQMQPPDSVSSYHPEPVCWVLGFIVPILDLGIWSLPLWPTTSYSCFFHMAWFWFWLWHLQPGSLVSSQAQPWIPGPFWPNCCLGCTSVTGLYCETELSHTCCIFSA